MQVTIVWAVREQPDDKDTNLHEFGLFYFRLIESEATSEEGEAPWALPMEGATQGTTRDPIIDVATPAVWVHFSDVSQIETLQFHCPDARLGPASSFTEGLVLTKNYEEAAALCKKLERLFMDAEMKEMLDEDVMEDY